MAWLVNAALAWPSDGSVLMLFSALWHFPCNNVPLVEKKKKKKLVDWQTVKQAQHVFSLISLPPSGLWQSFSISLYCSRKCMESNAFCLRMTHWLWLTRSHSTWKQYLSRLPVHKPSCFFFFCHHSHTEDAEAQLCKMTVYVKWFL